VTLNRLFARLPLERGLMFVSIGLGLVHAWVGRYSMNPDGMSYLDVGNSFFRRDWANAVNAHWSPLYPWALGLVVGLAKPSPKWEFPLVHLVNFGVFVVALFAFRFLLRALLAFVRERTSDGAPNGGQALPEWALVLLAYPIFLWTALEVETLYGVSPDLAVMACSCLTAGMLLRLRQGDRLLRFALFGLILGIGYWTKTILFPLGFVTLGAGYLWKRSRPGWGRGGGGSRSGLSVRLRSIDLLAISPEGPVYVRRFGEDELCVVRISPNVFEKLAGRSSRQWSTRSSDAATAAVPSAF